MHDSAAELTSAEPCLKLIVVEDDPLWRLLITQGLEERGCQVLEREDASDLNQFIRQFQPQAVLIDANLPGLDGFSACRLIREDPACAAVPALMLTGLEDDSSVQRAFDAGFDDFFVKSSRWSLLLQRVRSVIRLRSVSGQLSERQQQLEIAQEAGRIGSIDMDLETSQMWGAPGAFAVYGLSNDITELPVKVTADLMGEVGLERINNALKELVQTKQPVEVTLQVRGADGVLRTLHYRASILHMRGQRVKSIRAVTRDVSHEYSSAAEIKRLVNFDSLTGLVNRQHFLLCASALAQQPEAQFAIVAIDLDKFGMINAEFGQVAGDDLLVQLTRRWLDLLDLDPNDSQAYGADVLPRGPVLARLAGDDFALLVPASDTGSRLPDLIERCQRAFVSPFLVNGESVVVSASYGIAQFPRDGDSSGLLLSRADLAIASQKALGRSGVHWYSKQEAQPQRLRLEMATALRKALDEGQFKLHYQPVVDTRRHRVIGVEALMRWRRDDQLIPPVQFIPLAEELGLIIPMGEWAIGQAAWQLHQWRAAGLSLQSVAVNIPSEHFEHPSLSRAVQSAVESYGLVAGDLEIELTETNLVRDIERIRPRLDELNQLGVTLSLDDFGTGYSSLAYLARLPLGKLKIDRSFVNELGQSPQADTIVRAIISLGHALGLAVVAEGVETQGQVAALSTLGCNLVQGFFFSRPQPADQVIATVQRLNQLNAATHASPSIAISSP
jgi:diguanylate cyclase (GGDEF)-like protein